MGSNTLVAGSDSLEFGWLLMTWIPAVRKLSCKYNNTIVVCDRRNEYFYGDFATGFEHHSVPGHPDRWLANFKPERFNKVPSEVRQKYPSARYFEPDEKACTKMDREYKEYGVYNTALSFDLVIHARNTDKHGSTIRNWPEKNWDKLLHCLSKEKTLRIACIGSDDSLLISGCVDMRMFDSKSLCDTLRSSRLLIGPSSGPMHLGELCGTNRIVWTGKECHKILNGRTNRDRYLKMWKPFNSKVTVYDKEDWQPSVGSIRDLVVKELFN